MSGLTGVRKTMHDVMSETLADEAAHHDWTYHAVRPMPVPAKPWKPGVKIVGDCSKGCQYIAWWAGAPDPMGNHFGVYGNSQTIWLHLEHAQTASSLEVGDIITFGVDGDEHAAMVFEAGADPLLWSFGHQGAPNTYRLSFDGRIHQYCKLPIIPPPLTPAEKLQGMTGFYSWVAWKLGEGLWAHYGPSDPAVRPNVPRIIPALWWTRLATFLANRRHGNP